MAAVFGEVMPANTMIEAGDLIGDYEVEIEAEAVVNEGCSRSPPLPLSGENYPPFLHSLLFIPK